MVLDVRANRICLLVHRSGSSILHLGLIFGLRRFAYKAEQVGAESRNVEREALIDSEILRGQRCAWILGTYIQSPAGNKADDLLKAMKVAAPAIDFSRPRG
jgi:hypothetical protein